MRKAKYCCYQLVILILVFAIFSAVLLAADNEEVIDESTDDQLYVSVMFFETSIREAFNELSIQSGVNIIADQSVGGLVTADLQNVPLEKAVRIIASSGGYTYRKIDDYYLVGLADPENSTFNELSDMEVVRLNNITAGELLALVPDFLQFYVKGGTQSKFVTINAPDRELKKIKELIETVDYPRKQIEVKVLITEVDSEIVNELGAYLLDFDSGTSGVDSVSYDTQNGFLVLGTDFYGSLLSKFKLLEKEQKATVEADPRVLVADGNTAKLFIGDKKVLLISDSDDDFDRVEKIDVGVGLEVNARIVEGDEIFLTLNPEISRFVSEARPDIVVKQNSISTALRIKDGQTILIAGMTLSDDSSNLKKAPILGDIPIIRWLFRSESKREADRELLVFVTPVIK